MLPENVDHVIKACCVLHNYLTEAKNLPAINQRLNPDGIPSEKMEQFWMCKTSMGTTQQHRQKEYMTSTLATSTPPRCIALASKGSSGVKVHTLQILECSVVHGIHK